jgi:hypothetical protein
MMIITALWFYRIGPWQKLLQLLARRMEPPNPVASSSSPPRLDPKIRGGRLSADLESALCTYLICQLLLRRIERPFRLRFSRCPQTERSSRLEVLPSKVMQDRVPRTALGTRVRRIVVPQSPTLLHIAVV